MKHLSNLVLGSSSPEHVKCGETPGNLPPQRPEAAPCHTHPQQDFVQLLARYKRAGYEAVEQWNQTHHVNK